MIAPRDICLATPRDARRIAMMSRDHVEQGLGWRWTPPRILRMIRESATNVVVARDGDEPSGFAIMQYKEDEAHLLLLAVENARRRQGIGTALMAWLEDTALTAGIGLIYLETRALNREARAFYHKLRYIEIGAVPKLYSDREDGVRIAKDLWLGS